MKHLSHFLIAFFAIMWCMPIYAQTYNWVRGGGTSQSFTSYNFEEEILSMCTDPHGNVYALSIVGDDPIIADTFYRPTGAFGSPKNVLFTSHNCNGQMRFAKLISCNAATPYGVVADTSGHVYLALDLPHYATSSATTLRIGYDTTITAFIHQRVSLIQYDTNGHLNWVRFVGENILSTFNGTSGNNFLLLDGSYNPHLVAMTKFGVHLTPTVTSITGFYDLAYDVTGNLSSVKRLNIDTTLWVYGATIDKQSNKMYAHGYRSAAIYPGTQRYSFIASLDLNRNIIWIDTFANPYYPGNAGLGGIAADGNGHLYTTPNAARCFVYRGDTVMNAIATGSSKIASVMKLDTGGNVIWIKTYSGNTGVNSFFGVTMMPNNKIATSGVMTNKVVIGLDTLISYATEGQNAYFTIMDSSGHLHTIQQLHGIGFYDLANVSASDKVGNLYIGGKVENNIWAGSLTPYTSVGGDSDYFITKYGVDCGCTAMPVANYTYTGADLIRSFIYTGTTTGIDSVRWTFGDGGTSTSMTPTHTYTGPGTFTTCVRVYTSCGSDLRCYEITVSCGATAPVAAFTDTGSAIRGFTYTGTTAGMDSVVWDFGDGSTGTGLGIIHTYAVADTYHVCAKVYTNCGTDTFCNDIIVLATGSVSTVALINANIRVYPNPATNELYISGVAPDTHYRIVSAVGLSVVEGIFTPGTNILHLQHLATGIYQLVVTSPNGNRKILRIQKQ